MDPAWILRAEEFTRKLKATGLTKAEFQVRSGLTKNVIYNLSIGQPPSSVEQAAMLETAFSREAKGQSSL